MEFFDEAKTFISQPVNFSGNRSDCRLSYFRKHGKISGNVPSTPVTARMDISHCLAAPLHPDGNFCLQDLHEKSKSRSVETLSHPAGSKLPLVDFLFQSGVAVICSSLDFTAMVSGISPDKRICQNRSGSCKTSDPVSDMADICSIFKYSHCAAQVKKPLGQRIAVLRLNNHTLITRLGLVYIIHR